MVNEALPPGAIGPAGPVTEASCGATLLTGVCVAPLPDALSSSISLAERVAVVMTVATLVTLVVAEAVAVAPLPSVTVTVATYEPLSSGVKVMKVPLPLAYGEPFFVTDQA